MKDKSSLVWILVILFPTCLFAQGGNDQDYYFEISQLILTHRKTNEVDIISDCAKAQYSTLDRRRIRKGVIEAIDSSSITINGETTAFSDFEKIRIKGNVRKYRKNTKNHTFRPHPSASPAAPYLVVVGLGAMTAVQLATEVTGSEHKKENPYHYMSEWSITKKVTRYSFSK